MQRSYYRNGIVAGAAVQEERQGARRLQTGEMEPTRAKNRHRHVLPNDTAGLMGDPGRSST